MNYIFQLSTICSVCMSIAQLFYFTSTIYLFKITPHSACLILASPQINFFFQFEFIFNRHKSCIISKSHVLNKSSHNKMLILWITAVQPNCHKYLWHTKSVIIHLNHSSTPCTPMKNSMHACAHTHLHACTHVHTHTHQSETFLTKSSKWNNTQNWTFYKTKE
jgi:hypothetical protein